METRQNREEVEVPEQECIFLAFLKVGFPLRLGVRWLQLRRQFFAVLLITQSQTYTTNVPSGLVGELSLLPTRTSEIEPPSAQLNSEGSLLISVSTLALETSKVNARVSKDNSLIFDKIPLQPDEYGVAIVLIPTEGLVAGTYTMEISDGNNVRSHAFVITR